MNQILNFCLRNSAFAVKFRVKKKSDQTSTKIQKFEDEMSFLGLHPNVHVETQSEENGDDQTTSKSSNSLFEVSTKPNVLDTPNVHSYLRPSLGKKNLEVNESLSGYNLRSQIRPPHQPTVQTTSEDIDLFPLDLAETIKKLSYNEQVRLKIGMSNLVFEDELRNIPPVI